jgi:hypothetical protein
MPVFIILLIFTGIRKLLLHTDSQFLISCITVWIHKWKQNGWILSDGGTVKNKEDLIALDEALEGMSVKWVCITKNTEIKISNVLLCYGRKCCCHNQHQTFLTIVNINPWT